MKKIKRISAVSAALCLIFAAGCGDKNNNTQNSVIFYDNSNSYSQAAEGYENSKGDFVKNENLLENIPTTPGKLNEPAAINGIEVKITKVYNVGMLSADDMIPERQVLAFVVEVTNNTDAPIEENYFNLCIRYIDGEEVEVTPGVREVMLASDNIPDVEPLGGTIEPGQTLTGFAPFALYKEWQNLCVYFTPQHFGVKDSVSFEITKDMMEDPS